MKKYLLSIKNKNGITMSIIANTDSIKPIFIYYGGSDTGARYVNIGSAARILTEYAKMWGDDCIKKYGLPDDIPVKGCSKWNIKWFKYKYCGKPCPTLGDYLKEG